MSIVLKENDWAEQMISSKSLGDHPAETLRRVARYYLDKGCSKAEAAKRLEMFLLRCNPDASIPKWYDTITRSVRDAQKRPAVYIESIPIYKSELDVISRIKSKLARRLAFTLLCLSKYWNLVRGKSDYWVNSGMSEIMRMANVSTSFKRQCLLYYDLNESGMIQLSRKVDSTNVRVCFAKEDGDVAMEITDFRNLGYRYLMYCGEDFFECENCGIVTKIKSKDGNVRKQKYCPSCSAEMMVKRNVESVMRIRGRTQKNKTVGVLHPS